MILRINLVIERADQVINLYEMKDSDYPYSMTQTEEQKLRLCASRRLPQTPTVISHVK